MRVQKSESESVSTAVVRAVANVEDVPPSEIPPLYDHVDPDALDALVDRSGEFTGGVVRITFTYLDYRLTVTQHGTVVVTNVQELSGEKWDGSRTNRTDE